MLYRNHDSQISVSWCIVALLLVVVAAGCSTEGPPAPSADGVHQIAPGAENAGFLTDYSNLEPVPDLEGDIVGYVNQDEQKNLYKYVAIIVDPVQLYVVTDSDPNDLEEDGREAVRRYFRHALVEELSDAYPIAREPGPLVLRLRAAVVGIDIGGEVPAGDVPADTAKPLKKAIDIGSVHIELELVDSMTSDVIAAVVDRETLGADAEIGTSKYSRVERFTAAAEAFDEWAGRIRDFLDEQRALEGEDAGRVDESYVPYGS